MGKSLSYLTFLILCLSVIRCAQQGSPTGGPKDKTNPRITESEPLNFSTNYSGDHIYLEFDEYIKQNNLFTEMVISPTLKYQPEVKFKPKSMELIILDTLQENTTYTFNFGDGVVDITEANPLDSNLFVFSTGDYLDSLHIEGIVKTAFDLKPQEDIYVMLYDEFEDSLPRTIKPTYFAKTEKSGKYRIDYIKTGKYKVFALKDENLNYLFDQPEEAIGFGDEPVDVLTTDTLDLMLFQEEIQQQYLKTAKAEFYGQILFIYNLPAKDPKVRLLSPKKEGDWFREELFVNQDTLCYWLPGSEGGDTLEFQVWEGDSILDTTTVITPRKGAKAKKSKRKKLAREVKFSFRSNIIKGKIDVFNPLRFTFSYPIATIDVSKALFTRGEDTLQLTLTFRDSIHRKLEIDYDRTEGMEYRLFIPPGSITDIFGLKNDTIDLKFSTRSAEDYGHLQLTLNVPDSSANYVILLMINETVKREQSVMGNQTINYKNLLPGKYKMKLIYDTNGNGKWDTGDYSEKRQPEKVIYYSGKMEIRANWDQELEWVIE